MSDFRTVALALRPYISDVYNLTDATDAVLSTVTPQVADDDHERFVMAALTSKTIIDHLRNGQKISAIKELRTNTFASLKEAKDAVEDYRVNVHYVRNDAAW